MFDVSFSELILIGVIALIVIGPERLPKVARTIGHLVGRAQRYVNDVKSDIQREMDLDELTNLKGQMEEAANTVKNSIHDATTSLRKPIDEAQDAINDAAKSLKEAEPKSPPSTAEADAPADTQRELGLPAPAEPTPASAPPDDTASRVKTGTPT
jgi:sec-independent protein translocase protein TatB